MATVTKPIALDETLQATNAQLETTDATPVNIADVLQTGLANVASAIGSSSAGHTIQDNDGQDMPQRDNLQFVGVYTSDNQADDKTEVNIVRTMTKAQMDALSSAEKVGFIETSDEADNPYMTPSADDVSYNNASSGLSATNVNSAIDELNDNFANIKAETIIQYEAVTANTAITTDINFGTINTSKILMVQVTWNNPSSDTPTDIVYYPHGTTYISRITHSWSVSQNVRFIILVLHA